MKSIFEFVSSGMRRPARALRRIALSTVACVLAFQAHAYAQYYPQCETPFTGNCSMPDQNGAPGMLTPINVYLIWYGNWANSGIDLAIEQFVPTLINGMNDSAYTAIWQTYNSNYGHPDGQIKVAKQFFDNPGRVGSSLSDGSSRAEISNLIGNGILPNDINGVYVVLPHSDVPSSDNQGNQYCNGFCGYNSDSVIQGTHNIKYVVVPESGGNNCPSGCRWGFLTPNIAGGLDVTGQIDGELNVLAHELSESVTDPTVQSGWYNNNSGSNTQMADYCVGFGATAQGAYYRTFSATCPYGANCSTIANAHLNGNDFLIQELRTNANNGGFGYCSNYNGGPFWGANFGFSWSPTFPADWSPGNYKGECQTQQPLIGISTFTSSPNQAHEVFCDTGASWNHDWAFQYFDYYAQSDLCHLSPFDGLDGFVNNYNVNGNWDPGYYVNQCNQDEFAAGVSQSTSGRVNGLLCCPGTGYGVAANKCVREIVGASSIPSTDWDYGSYKAQCPTPGQYVAGVSAVTSSGAPHAILCCSP